jgi:F-type H+-transporting ATPase subunit b
MSSSTKSGGSILPGLIAGIVLMVGGGVLKQVWHPEFLHTLEQQGIPLDPGKTVSAIGVFLILFGVIRVFFFQPLDDAINQRTHELETTFSEAESLRADMTKMRSEYESRLAKTEADAREQIQTQVKEAQALGQQLRAEAAVQVEEMKRKAADEIAQQRDKVMRDIQLSVVNLTLQATEKLVGENIDSEKNRKLVEEFIQKVEVPR